MSTHSAMVLATLGRALQDVYDRTTHGSIGFPAAVPYANGAIVVHSPVSDPSEDSDPNRRDAHCDVSLADCHREVSDKVAWKLVAAAISHSAQWIQPVT